MGDVDVSVIFKTEPTAAVDTFNGSLNRFAPLLPIVGDTNVEPTLMRTPTETLGTINDEPNVLLVEN